MEKVAVLQVVDTGLCADSVEWCPHLAQADILLCGTYQLQQPDTPPSAPMPATGHTQVRLGQLHILQLEKASSSPLLLERQRVDMAGILDIKWAPELQASCPVFGLVTAEGQLELWTLGASDEAGSDAGKEARRLKTVAIADCIALSLDWEPAHQCSAPRVVTSDSTGGVSVFEVTSDIHTVSQWHAHDFEAWICAFDKWNKHLIYTGSDDCKLKVWDLRQGPSPVSTNSRFTMGVTSIQSNPHRQHLLAVGSYDERVQIFDSRHMRSALSASEVGGGVWRVKWDPFAGNSLLTATMHNGFHVLDASRPDAESLPILAHYTNHSSLAYGADWCRLDFPPTPTPQTQRAEEAESGEPVKHTQRAAEAESGEPVKHAQRLVASCSFYDHSLHLWHCSLPAPAHHQLQSDSLPACR